MACVPLDVAVDDSKMVLVSPVVVSRDVDGILVSSALAVWCWFGVDVAG